MRRPQRGLWQKHNNYSFLHQSTFVALAHLPTVCQTLSSHFAALPQSQQVISAQSEQSN